MSSIQVREVNVVPVTKIKIEIPDDDECEDTVLCKICSKSFVSEIAVRNHARMEHITEFMAGADLFERPVYTGPKRKYTEAEQQDIQARTSELVSSMRPASITSLASKDVSYIIIKDEDAVTVQKMRKLEKSTKQAKPVKQASRREKQVIPISGPFECLQPSTSNPEAPCHQMFLSCCEYSAHYRDEHTRRRKGSRCQVCEKPITGNEQLVPFSCQVCGTGFENSKELNEHSQTAHIKLKPFQCSVCLKRFTQQGGLQQHMRRHTGDRPFPCTYCPKAFTQKSGLDQHLRIHTKCSVCLKRFTQQGGLQQHMRRHTGDRPFPCTYCPKAFTQKSGLDQHLRIHTKVKPYRCVICIKAFCQSVHLQQHMRTHTNVAPFQCGICQKRFKQSSHLNYHLKYHNVVKMTDEQKQKYAQLMSQIVMKQEYVDVEVDESVTSQHEIGQSVASEYEILEAMQEIQEEEVDQTQMTEEEVNQSEMTQEEVDQSDMAQEEEIDQSKSQHSDNEEIGETVYILNESDVWCEGVVCEQ